MSYYELTPDEYNRLREILTETKNVIRTSKSPKSREARLLAKILALQVSLTARFGA